MFRPAVMFLAFAVAGALLAAAAFAQAQPSGREKPPALAVGAIGAPAAGQGGGHSPVLAKADVAPARLQPMLASQNDARAKLGLGPLVWSSELQKASEATVTNITGGLCTSSIVRKAATPSLEALYWASPVRDHYGGQKPQDISPAFVVSQWKDRAARLSRCERDADCNAWALLTRKTAARVGCATAVCPNQARVWICRYGD